MELSAVLRTRDGLGVFYWYPRVGWVYSKAALFYGRTFFSGWILPGVQVEDTVTTSTWWRVCFLWTYRFSEEFFPTGSRLKPEKTLGYIDTAWPGWSAWLMMAAEILVNFLARREVWGYMALHHKKRAPVFFHPRIIFTEAFYDFNNGLAPRGDQMQMWLNSKKTGHGFYLVPRFEFCKRPSRTFFITQN